MPSVCTGLPQRCPLCPGWVPGSRDTLGQQVLPTLGWITWAVGLCLLPARAREMSLCKHAHNRRKPGPSFEVEPHSSNPTGLSQGQCLSNEMAAKRAGQVFSTLSEGRSHFGPSRPAEAGSRSPEVGRGSPSALPHGKGLACCAARGGAAVLGPLEPCKRVELGCTPVAQHLLHTGQERVLHKRRTHFLCSALQKEK